MVPTRPSACFLAQARPAQRLAQREAAAEDVVVSRVEHHQPIHRKQGAIKPWIKVTSRPEARGVDGGADQNERLDERRRTSHTSCGDVLKQHRLQGNARTEAVRHNRHIAARGPQSA